LNANAKKLYLLKYFAKSKKKFFPISVILRFIPNEIPQNIKLKPPNVYTHPMDDIPPLQNNKKNLRKYMGKQ
jgi:hypothetical protein